ncbi:MAG: tetratricopeptide repeat protein, partial [Burkholderiales bacterium]|nr:tetratricopeptide repeat protein [Burkholderiales bacterium]
CGRAARAVGRRDTARAAFETALRLAPGLAPAWFALALVCQDERDLAAAQKALEQLLRLQPQHVEAAVNLGLVQQQQGRLDAAMACYGRAYRARPGATFGRIANALCAEPCGQLWLDPEALRAALQRA